MILYFYEANFKKKRHKVDPSGFYVGGVAGRGHDHRVIGRTNFSCGSEGD